MSRPDNLYIIQNNIRESLLDFDVRWYCVYDPASFTGIKIPLDIGFTKADVGGPERDCAGGSQKNIALDWFSEGWVYILDDDNLIHPSLNNLLKTAIMEHPDCQGFVFNQVFKDGRTRLRADGRILQGNIDTGQYVLQRHAIGKIRFKERTYHSDYLFLSDVVAAGAKVEFIPETASFYNALR